MGDFKDHERAKFRAFHGMPTRPPRTFAEGLGQAAGEAARRQHQERVSQTESATGSARGVLFKLALGVSVLLVIFPGGPGGKAIPLCFGALLLFTIPLARFLLRRLTPVYIGMLLGFIVWTLRYLKAEHLATMNKLAWWVGLGAAAGLVYAIARWKGRT